MVLENMVCSGELQSVRVVNDNETVCAMVLDVVERSVDVVKSLKEIYRFNCPKRALPHLDRHRSEMWLE